MNYSEKEDKFVQEFIDHFGEENIPNPQQYPRRFEFLVKSFQHYKRMQQYKTVGEDTV
jgi:hypothetical protein